MSDPTDAQWIIGLLLYVLLHACLYFIGQFARQTLLRMKKHSDDWKWGEKEILFRQSPSFLIVVGLELLIGAGIFAYVAFIFLNMITATDMSIFSRVLFVVVTSAYTVIVGVVVESIRINKVTKMTKSLNDLRKPFHTRFDPTELISMYEDLTVAPSIFWEEYASLPKKELTQQTNAQYRQRVAVYVRSEERKYNKILAVVAVLSLQVTIILAIVGFVLSG